MVPLDRRAVERLRELALAQERLQAEASGILFGAAMALGLDPSYIAGWDDGPAPGLIYAPPPEPKPSRRRRSKP